MAKVKAGEKRVDEEAGMAIEYEEALVRPLGEGTVPHGGEKKICVLGESGGNKSRKDFRVASVEECADERANHVQGAVVFGFKHFTSSVLSDEAVKDMEVVGRGEVDVVAGSWSLLSDRC